MGKKLTNPSDIANKWATSMGSASSAYTSGVQSVTQSPGQSALNNAQAYLNGVQDAYNNGTYQKGLQSFTLQDWQNAAVSKGASRLGSGAQASKGRMQTFFSNFIPQLQNIQNQIDQMPNGSFAERQQRAITYMNLSHQLKGTLKVK